MKKNLMLLIFVGLAAGLSAQTYYGQAVMIFQPDGGESFALEMPLTEVNWDAGTAGFTFAKNGIQLQFSYTVDMETQPLSLYMEYRGKPYYEEVRASREGVYTVDTETFILAAFQKAVSVAGTTMSTPVAVNILPGSSVAIEIEWEE